ncbi:MAG: hypothetical protein ACFFDI_15065 [Promethearchaeota archaeon]
MVHPRATFGNLLLSIIIDLIGLATFLLFPLSEVGDILWAGISGFFIYQMYGSRKIALFGAIEEILPISDIIPTATLTWFYFFFFKKEEPLPESSSQN